MKRLSAPIWLVIINISIFLTIWIVSIAAKLMGYPSADLVDWLALSALPATLLHRPWTLITYMFTQYDIWHVVFNVLILYWMGELLLTLLSSARIVWLYILSGLLGGMMFFGIAQFAPQVGETLVGASASVLAIVVAAGVIMPDLEMLFAFLFRLRLKWVALILVAIFVVSQGGGNYGGQAAHLGGALFGLLYGIGFRRGRDLLAPFVHITDRAHILLHRKEKKRNFNPHPRTAPSNNGAVSELDSLLDKIRKSGYSSLTPEERERLIEISKKIK